MKLSNARPGDLLTISYFPSGTVFLRAQRLGLDLGSRTRCAFVLPSGPVVLQLQRQMIAIGHRLAKQIIVEVNS